MLSENFFVNWFTKMYNKEEEIDQKLNAINTRLNQLNDLEMKLNAVIKKSNRVYNKQSAYNQIVTESQNAPTSTSSAPKNDLDVEQLMIMFEQLSKDEKFNEYVSSLSNNMPVDSANVADNTNPPSDDQTGLFIENDKVN